MSPSCKLSCVSLGVLTLQAQGSQFFIKCVFLPGPGTSRGKEERGVTDVPLCPCLGGQSPCPHIWEEPAARQVEPREL